MVWYGDGFMTQSHSESPPSDLPRAARALTLAARAIERAAAARNLTLAQFRILVLIAAGDERSSLLAERLAVAKPTITAVVDGLVERGLVIREAVVGDRRSIRVALTPAGVTALQQAEDEMSETLDRIFEHARDRDRLVGALLDLDDALALRMEARLKDARGHEVTT
jgi:DNA-binding MarR family transcriptional regulator